MHPKTKFKKLYQEFSYQDLKIQIDSHMELIEQNEHDGDYSKLKDNCDRLAALSELLSEKVTSLFGDAFKLASEIEMKIIESKYS